MGSPAIDAGKSNFKPADPDGNPLTDDAVPFDQRGAPFNRVFDGDSADGARVDIGANELQPKGVQGDYNQNGVVDAADYVVWRETLTTSVVPPFIGADGDGDGAIDQDDYGVWRSHFGETLPGVGAGNELAEASSVERQEVRAEALSTLRSAADHTGEPVLQLSTEATAAPAETEAATARAASFALLETRSLWHGSGSPSRAKVHRYPVGESGGDGLSLLLAIDRVWRSPRQDRFVSDHSGSDEHRTNDDHSRSLIDRLLASALEAPF